jgi:glutamate/tyrosine decarboxylase-like PLP-dependent enzyme
MISAQRDLLERTAALAEAFLDTVASRPVGQPIARPGLQDLVGPLPEVGVEPATVIEELAAAADPGLVASAGPRYFGFVIGGSLPAALAADWLTSAWDQNAGLYLSSPATSVIEDVAAAWILELLDLPRDASIGFTTGATMANFTGLAAARDAVLERVGWDVEARGLAGAPPIRIVVGDEVHASAVAALRMLGLGAETAVRIPTDEQGRMRADAFTSALAGTSGPTIVLAQAGNVNTGAFDPIAEIVQGAHAAGAWVHVDGAFGLWAAVSPTLRPHLAGISGADSWATDAHKWLNVPYDCGIVAVADRRAHERAATLTAAYLMRAPDRERDPFDWVPEGSRRARATPVYAAIRSLGRQGLQELIERSCSLARRMADRLAEQPRVEILNDVVLNQALVRFGVTEGGGDDVSVADAMTRATIAAVQADGTCWVGGTTWHGRAAMRISVSGWNTTESDADVSVEAIIRCFHDVRTAR